MKKNIVIIAFVFFNISFVFSQYLTREDYYVAAYKEIVSMLEGKDSISIKRAVFLAEWAYYEGNLDYKKDFCNEIDRIATYIKEFYEINKLHNFKTGKQMALNEYFFRPYSGNYYKPYTYDFENFSIKNDHWESQFVSEVLKNHQGQCRSLPWLYKIIANEINADVAIAYAPGHCYIMYKDLDRQTPEEWINLELTTQQMQPAFWIKKDFEISDSAIIVGTYMTPLTDRQVVACQLGDLAHGYMKKFNRYDEFTFVCATKSIEYYQNRPNAIIIRGKSLEAHLRDYLLFTNGIFDSYANEISNMIFQTQELLKNTYWTEDFKGLKEYNN